MAAATRDRRPAASLASETSRSSDGCDDEDEDAAMATAGTMNELGFAGAARTAARKRQLFRARARRAFTEKPESHGRKGADERHMERSSNEVWRVHQLEMQMQERLSMHHQIQHQHQHQHQRQTRQHGDPTATAALDSVFWVARLLGAEPKKMEVGKTMTARLGTLERPGVDSAAGQRLAEIRNQLHRHQLVEQVRTVQSLPLTLPQAQRQHQQTVEGNSEETRVNTQAQRSLRQENFGEGPKDQVREQSYPTVQNDVGSSLTERGNPALASTTSPTLALLSPQRPIQGGMSGFVATRHHQVEAWKPSRAEGAAMLASAAMLGNKTISPFALSSDHYRTFLWLESGKRKLLRMEAKLERKRARSASLEAETVQPMEKNTKLLAVCKRATCCPAGRACRIISNNKSINSSSTHSNMENESSNHCEDFRSPDYCWKDGQNMLVRAVSCTEHSNAHQLRKLLRKSKSLLGNTQAACVALQCLHRCCVTRGSSRVTKVIIRFLHLTAKGWDEEEISIPDEWMDPSLAGANASMLCEAVRYGSYETASALLHESASSPMHCMAANCTPLVVAVYQNNTQMTRLLLERGADANSQMSTNNITPLAVAAVRGNIECARVLVSAGADPNSPSLDGTTPLMWAVQVNNKAMVEFLLSSGADVNLCKTNGSSPIIVAVRHGRANMIPLLAQYGGDPNLVLSNGATALILASANGDLEAVDHLLQMNSDTTKRLNSGAHALAYACHRGHRDVIIRCIAHPGALPAADFDRLLLIASIKKHSAIEEWLKLYKKHGRFTELHFTCSLGMLARTYGLLRCHGRFSELDREVLPRISLPFTRPYVELALAPYSIRNAYLWPQPFNAVVNAVIDSTSGGQYRDIFLHVFSFCDRDWFGSCKCTKNKPRMGTTIVSTDGHASSDDNQQQQSDTPLPATSA